MADGDMTDAAPVTAQPDASPTPQQEQDVNSQLFGGQQPGQQQNKPPTEQRDPTDPLVSERLRIYEEDRKRADEANSQYDRMRGELSDINKQIAGMQMPESPKQEPLPSYQDFQQQQQQQGRSVSNIIGQVLQIAAIASAVFGKGNAWQKATMYNGVASFINGFQKAQNQQAMQALQVFNRNVEYADKQNKENTQTYKDILENKRLTLTQQMDLMKTVAAQRSDTRMYTAAANKDLNELMKTISDKQKANLAWAKAQANVNQSVVKQWMKTSQGKTWAAWVESKYGIDPTESQEKYLEANQKYPVSKWIDEHVKKQDVPEDTEQSPSESSNVTHVTNAEEYNNLPSGTVYTDPDGVQRTKP